MGESDKTTGENRSVADISLSVDQIELIDKAKATGKRVIGVFFCGRPIAMQGVADKLDAVLYAWHSGSETANAVCDILFGDVNPSGKTAVTFPKKSGHIPLYYNVTSSGRPVNCYYGEGFHESQDFVKYTEDIFVGYRYFETIPNASKKVVYPFGYGLSYTKFEYSKPLVNRENLSLSQIENGDKFKITVTVKNMGCFDGKETVQLYIHDKFASIMRPMRELKAFEKPMIKSGEIVQIEFELGYEDLGFYLDDGTYTIEKGDFDIYVGKDCLTKNKTTITVI